MKRAIKRYIAIELGNAPANNRRELRVRGFVFRLDRRGFSVRRAFDERHRKKRTLLSRLRANGRSLDAFLQTAEIPKGGIREQVFTFNQTRVYK